jgi:hypothetical protein
MGEGDPEGRSTVLITVLSSWEKSVPHGHEAYKFLLHINRLITGCVCVKCVCQVPLHQGVMYDTVKC